MLPHVRFNLRDSLIAEARESNLAFAKEGHRCRAELGKILYKMATLKSREEDYLSELVKLDRYSRGPSFQKNADFTIIHVSSANTATFRK